jgi:hypothetical protein
MGRDPKWCCHDLALAILLVLVLACVVLAVLVDLHAHNAVPMRLPVAGKHTRARLLGRG